MEEEERARITNKMVWMALWAIDRAPGVWGSKLTKKELIALYNHNAEILDEDPMELDDMT